ncbi:MAG TPA: sigma-70 family RNA polymerase sigma factor [Nocardioidaceae bacterium]
MDIQDFEQRLAAAKRGDEDAFVVLFRSVQPALLRYLRSLGGPLAEDAAADTWVSVVRGLDRFSGDEAGWRAWVMTIGRARLRDAQRKAARTPIPFDVAEMYAAVPDGVDVHASVEEIFSTEAALEIIGRLPPEQAETVLLRYVAGLDVGHTAEVMGKRPGAVRVSAHRGLRRLAAMLQDAGWPVEGCNGARQSVDS